MTSVQSDDQTGSRDRLLRRISAALTAIALCTLGTVLYFAHAAFAPIALAFLCALVLSGPVEALQRLHVPRGASATIIMVVVLALSFGLIEMIWLPAQQWFDRAPRDVELIKQKLTPLTHLVTHIEDLRNSARTVEKSAAPATTAVAPLVVENGALSVLEATRTAAFAVLAFVAVTLFLLVGGPPMLANMSAAVTNELHSTHVINLIEKVRLEVGRFYVASALINFAFGCVVAGVMAAWGLPNPLLWGTIAGLLNFVPYAGSATTLIVLTLVTLASFDSLGRVAGVLASYLVLTTIVGQLVQPLIVGRRLQVNPLLIFLSLWFFGVFWGVAGIILSTPILVACKVLAEHATHGAAVLRFLGPPPLSSTLLAKLRRL